MEALDLADLVGVGGAAELENVVLLRDRSEGVVHASGRVGGRSGR